MLVTLILLAYLAHGKSSRDVDYCYADVKEPYHYMATKTPYHFVHGGQMGAKTVPDCEPVQIWLLSRHGTRFPSVEEIQAIFTLPEFRDKIIENHEKHDRGRLCDKDLANLKGWKVDPNLDVKKAKFLTTQGEKDFHELAKRLQSNYPKLLNPQASDVTSENYHFRSTDKQRTIASMDAFMEGLFGNSSAVDKEVVPIENDTLLMSYKHCATWNQEVGGHRNEMMMDEFFNGSEFVKLVANVTRRLGFVNNITTDQVLLLYQACRFEKSWYVDKLSPWCAVFSKDELEILEYEEDLFCYYYSGYGENLTPAIGCSPLQDMFNSFQRFEKTNDTVQPKGVFYFAHDVTLQQLFVTMGVAKDETPMRASQYRDEKDRLWRTSLLAPFATNFAAVFYECGLQDVPRKTFKAKFYLAEHPLSIEGCENDICDWDYVKRKFGLVAFNCNVEFCSKGGSCKS